jgi:hypothetical protein
MLSMQWNRFPVCSACDEISSPYAQCAIKFVPRMLSINCTCKTVHILPLAEHARKFVPRMLSMRWNRFRVCSACDKIVSGYAQHTHAIIFENDSKIPNWKANFAYKKPKFWKTVYAYAQSPRKCSNIEILAKIEAKETKFFCENLRRAYKDLI